MSKKPVVKQPDVKTIDWESGVIQTSLSEVEGKSIKGKTTSDKESSTQFVDIYTIARNSLNEVGYINDELLAKLIKFQLLQYKSEDINRRQNMKDTIKSPTEVRSPSRPHKRSKDLTQINHNSATEIPDFIKQNRLKDGEYLRSETIDDEPPDGPSYYFLLFGFYQVGLLEALEEIGIICDAIIRIKIQFDRPTVQNKDVNPKSSVMNSLEQLISVELLDADKDVSGQLHIFWEELNPRLNSAKPDSCLHDIVLLELIINSSEIPSISSLPDVQEKFNANLFTRIAELMYNIRDLKRQHKLYLDNLKLIHIPTVDEHLKQDVEIQSQKSYYSQEGSVFPDMDLYNELLSKIPSECLTIPVLLHCILEQVIHNSESQYEYTKSEKTDKPSEAETEFLMCLNKVSQNHNLLNNDSSNSKKFPVLINHGDELKATSYHLSSNKLPFNLETAHTNITFTNPILGSLFSFPPSNRRQELIRKSLYKQFMDFFQSWEISSAEIDHTLKQFAFETMTIKTVDDKGKIKENPPVIAVWNIPCQTILDTIFPELKSNTSSSLDSGATKFLKKNIASKTETPVMPRCPIPQPGDRSITCECLTNLLQNPENFVSLFELIKSSLSNTSVASSTVKKQLCHYLRSLEDYTYVECFPKSAFCQVLYKALEDATCADMIYHDQDHCYLMIVHSPYNKNRQSYYEWEAKINTNVKLRNFHEYVLGSIQDWISKEEGLGSHQNIAAEKNLPCPELNILSPIFDPSVSVATVLGDPEWIPQIVKASLKYKIYGNHAYGEIDQYKSVNEVESKGKRHSTGDIGKIKNSRKVSPEIDYIREEHKAVHEEPKQWTFIGYDIGNILLHVSGVMKHVYPEDGAHITVENYSYIYGRNRTKISIKRDDHFLNIHLPIKDKHAIYPGQFQAILAGGLVVRSSQVLCKSLTSPSLTPSNTSYVKSEGEVESPELSTNIHDDDKHEKEDEISITLEAQEFTCTLPILDLIIKIVPYSKNAVVHYFIRQTYVEENGKLPEREISRIITDNGQVIKTLKDGSSEIFQPDGTILRGFWSLNEKLEKLNDIVSEVITLQELDFAKENDKHKRGINFFKKTREDMLSYKKKLSNLETFSPSNATSLIASDGNSVEFFPVWQIIKPNGISFLLQPNGKIMNLPVIQGYTAVDPHTKEAYSSRDDGLEITHKPGVSCIVHFYDGTRITSKNISTDTKIPSDSGGGETTICIENPHFVKVYCYPRTGSFQIYMQEDTVLRVNPLSSFLLEEEDGSKFSFNIDGTVLFSPITKSDDCKHHLSSYIISPNSEVCLEVIDDKKNNFQFKSDGSINFKQGFHRHKSEKCLTNEKRYFVIYDKSGAELLPTKYVEGLINQVMNAAEGEVQINHLPNDNFVRGISAFIPMPPSPLHKWILPYELETIVPCALTCRDLQPSNIIPNIKHKRFGYNVGSGLNIKKQEAGSTSLLKINSPCNVWEVRQYLQFRKASAQVKEDFETKVWSYIKLLCDIKGQKFSTKFADDNRMSEQDITLYLMENLKGPGLMKKRHVSIAVPRQASNRKAKKVSLLIGGTKAYTYGKAKSKIEMELEEQKRNLKILYHSSVPPYFKSEVGLAALHQIKQQGKQSRVISKGNNLKLHEEKTPPLLSSANQHVLSKGVSSFLLSPLKHTNVKQRLTNIELAGEIRKLSAASKKELGFAAKNAVEEELSQNITRAGFLLKPTKIDFGSLCEGKTYRCSAYIKNCGLEKSEITVRQPPESTGIRVIYHRKMVAPGMTIPLSVELHAIRPLDSLNSSPSVISYDLEICTQVETLFLPITAAITCSETNLM